MSEAAALPSARALPAGNWAFSAVPAADLPCTQPAQPSHSLHTACTARLALARVTAYSEAAPGARGSAFPECAGEGTGGFGWEAHLPSNSKLPHWKPVLIAVAASAARTICLCTLWQTWQTRRGCTQLAGHSEERWAEPDRPLSPSPVPQLAQAIPFGCSYITVAPMGHPRGALLLQEGSSSEQPRRKAPSTPACSQAATVRGQGAWGSSGHPRAVWRHPHVLHCSWGSCTPLCRTSWCWGALEAHHLCASWSRRRGREGLRGRETRPQRRALSCCGSTEEPGAALAGGSLSEPCC